MKQLIELFPKMLAAASTGTLMILVMHEWAYFGVIGGNFQSLMTTSDYIANAVFWFTPVVITIFFVGMSFAYTLRADDFQPKGYGPSQAKTKSGRFISDWWYEIFLAVLAIASIFQSTSNNSWLFITLLALLYMRLAAYVMGHDTLKDRISRPLWALITFFPTLLIVFYGVGRIEAYEDMKQKTRYDLRLKDETTGRKVIVLRILEKGVLILDPALNKVQFYRQDNVALLEKDGPILTNEPLSCVWFKLRCKSQNPTVTPPAPP